MIDRKLYALTNRQFEKTDVAVASDQYQYLKNNPVNCWSEPPTPRAAFSFELCNLDGSGITRENGRKNAKLNGHKSDVSVNPAISIQIICKKCGTVG
jgi:hypothetical protein